MNNLKFQVFAYILLICMLFGVGHANITDTQTYSSDDFDSTVVVAPDSNSYIRISSSLTHQINIDEEGAPELPAFAYVYSLPEDEEVDSVIISSSSSSTLFTLSYPVYPKQTPWATHVDSTQPDFVTPLPVIYGDTLPYPSNISLVDVIEPLYFSFGMGMATIVARPIQYDVDDDEVDLYTSISYTIYTSSASKSPVVADARSTFAHEFIKDYLKGIVENPSDVESNLPEPPTIDDYNYPTVPPDIPSDYIIVTAYGLQSYCTDLKYRFESQGLLARIYTLQNDIYPYYSGDNAKRLRDFIIDKYEDGALYVILMGNTDIVPFRYAYPGNVTNDPPPVRLQQICDLYFADVDGDWDYDNDGVYGESYHDRPDIGADIFVGRVPIGNTGDILDWESKLVIYEDNPGNGSYGYLSDVIISASDQMTDRNQPEQIEPVFSNFFDVDITGLRELDSGEDPSPWWPYGEDYIDYLNSNPPGILISLHHGNYEYFASRSGLYNRYGWSGPGTPDPDLPGFQLTWMTEYGWLGDFANGYKQYVHSANSCYLGFLDVQDLISYWTPCYAEDALTLEGGPVAGTYNTRWGWVNSSKYLEITRFDLLCDEDYQHRFGVVHYALKPPNAPYRDIVYGNTFFGDPSMPVWTDEPGEFIVECPDSVFRDVVETVMIRVKDDVSQIGVVDVMVTLSKGDEVYSRDETDITGRAYLPIDPDLEGLLKVFCSKINYISSVDTIDVVTYCDDAVAGDANGSGTLNGLDVTYLSSYFQGGPQPPDSCMCVDEDFLYHAADANGSCACNGLDLTYLSNYFKGGPAPLLCSSCPTGSSLLSKTKQIIAKSKDSEN
ncbi:MAG: hypothetical protein JSU85_14300 [Candidatus Zixiibacteriota bacterium]|nr:MAG: hypothetical protein JSU85_14300 [candidate division Zixibacteria bacterium]